MNIQSIKDRRENMYTYHCYDVWNID